MRSIKVQGKNLANFMLGHAYIMKIVGGMPSDPGN